MGLPDPLHLFGPGGLPDPLNIHASPRVPSPPAPPKADDPAVVAARKKQRASDLLRKGRASTILTGGAGVTSDAPLSQPQVLGT